MSWPFQLIKKQILKQNNPKKKKLKIVGGRRRLENGENGRNMYTIKYTNLINIGFSKKLIIVRTDLTRAKS